MAVDLNPPVLFIKFEKVHPTSHWEMIVPVMNQRIAVGEELSKTLDLLFLADNFEVEIPTI